MVTMIFNNIRKFAEFEKDFKKLTKKFRTLNEDLNAGDGRGRFQKDKAVNVFIHLGILDDMDTPGKSQNCRPFEWN